MRQCQYKVWNSFVPAFGKIFESEERKLHFFRPIMIQLRDPLISKLSSKSRTKCSPVLNISSIIFFSNFSFCFLFYIKKNPFSEIDSVSYDNSTLIVKFKRRNIIEVRINNESLYLSVNSLTLFRKSLPIYKCFIVTIRAISENAEHEFCDRNYSESENILIRQTSHRFRMANNDTI